MNYLIIGEQIQRYRKEAKLTQRELGESLGVSSSAVSQWETGGTPDISLLPAIADRLGVTINALFGREDVTQENMREALPRYVASLPESERLKELCRLMWEAVKAGYTGLRALSDDFLHNRHHIYYALDEGIIVGSDWEELSFLSVFPEPEKGYDAFFASDDSYRRLFSTLSKPHALALLKLLYQRPPKHCTPDVIAKLLGIGAEETQALLSEFSMLHLVRELELETERGDTKIYITNDSGALIPFLYAANQLIENQGNLSLTANNRKAPLLRKPDGPQKGETPSCSDI